MTISSSRARRREYRRRPSQAHPPSSTSAPSSSRRPSPRLPRHFRNSVAEDHYFDIISLIQDVSVTVTKYLLKMIGYSDTEIHQSLKSDTIRKQQLTTTPVDVTVSNISCIITYQQLIPDSKKGNRTLIFGHTYQEPDIQEYEGFDDDNEFQIEAPLSSQDEYYLDEYQDEYQGLYEYKQKLPKLPILPLLPVLPTASTWSTYLHNSLMAWRSETIHRPPWEVQGYRQ